MKCIKCGEILIKGKILNKSYDVHQRGGIIRVRPDKSDGKMVECLKCPKCGHSEVDERYVQTGCC